MSETPLIYSLGVIPLASTELGRLGSIEAMSIAEDNFQLPRECCSMVKTLLGEFYLRKDSIVKKVVTNIFCEPLKMLYDVIEKYGFDIKLIDQGTNVGSADSERYENLFKHYVEEIQDVARWLTGHEIDEDKLGAEIKRYNRVLKKAFEFLKLKKKHPKYVLSLPTVIVILGSAHYFGKPDEYEAALDELIDELKSLGDDEYNDKVVPILWSGARGQEFGVYQAIDEAGGSILGWASAPRLNSYFDESIPPLESFINYQLTGLVGSKTADGYPFVEAEIKRSGAKGILQYGYIGCSTTGISSELTRKYFHNRGIPSMELFGSYQVGAPSGQLITRVKAFIEMLA